LIDGRVRSVDPTGPAAGLLLAGDVVLRVDGVLAPQAASVYGMKQPGDTLELTVRRDSDVLKVLLTLSNPPGREILERVAILVVALAFWVIGVLVSVLGPPSTRKRVFFLLSMLVTGLLATGLISSRSPAWVSLLFNLLLWWSGPETVHLHLTFQEKWTEKGWRYLLVFLVAAAVLGSLPYLILGAGVFAAPGINRLLHTFSRLNLSLNLVLSVALALTAYVRAPDPTTRLQIRLIAFYGSLSILSPVVLSILPGAVTGTPLVPYELSFLFLILIPMAYGYTIARTRLIRLEWIMSRSAAYALVFLTLFVVYFTVFLSIGWLTRSPAREPLGLEIVLGLALAALFEPLRRRLQALVDWLLYGGWYDYRSAVEQITRGLQQYTAIEPFAKDLSYRLETTLRLEYAYLLLHTSHGLLPLGAPRDGCPPEVLAMRLPPEGRRTQEANVLARYLRGGVEVAGASEAPLSTTRGDASEGQAQFTHVDKDMLVNVYGSEGLQGVLVVGPKLGREAFSSEDYAILAVVARQVGAAVQNIQSLTELRRRANEVETLHQEIQRAREEERKRISRKLHDEIIQALVGLNYRLAGSADPVSASLKNEVRQIVSDLRQISSELRPPALDNLGLVSAIRSRLRELTQSNGDSLRSELSIEGDEDLLLPEEVSLCLYRVFSEAVTNTLKHAKASHLRVRLHLNPERVELLVADDGRGFQVPYPLGELLAEQHFGLVGIRERLDAVHGELDIQTRPGGGTRLAARINLPIPESGNRKE
jgi:signal transduction histidine kinase